MEPIRGLTAREHDAFLIHAEGIDDRLMSGEIVDENAFRALPLLDAERVSDVDLDMRI